MTDLLQTLYDYLLEYQSKKYLPVKYFWHHTRVAGLREQALLDALTPAQRELLEDYQSEQDTCAALEKEALFQAALALARELARLMSPSA